MGHFDQIDYLKLKKDLDFISKEFLGYGNMQHLLESFYYVSTKISLSIFP